MTQGMNATFFAFALLLRNPGRKSELLALLSEQRRVEVESVLQGIGSISDERIRQEFTELRLLEVKSQRARFEKPGGVVFHRASPRLTAWLSRPF
jgi:hypothetical protein